MNPFTILVVEDNPITRKLVGVTLASEGYRVLEAADGRGAVALMKLRLPHLVLQDLVLPDVDGLELVRQLRSLPGGATVPILAISGFLSKVDQARSLQVGFTDYLFKPVDPAHLLYTVRAYLKPPTPAGPSPGRGQSVLVADDDPAQLKLLKVQLEQLGYRLTTARDGLEALDKARQSPPDALVCDVLMPGLDGFRVCQAVRSDPRLAGAPVVLISAVYTEEADRRLARAVGASALVARTPDHQAAITALRDCLARGPLAAPAQPVELPLEEYTHRVIRQLENQVSLGANLARRLALLEAELGILARVMETLHSRPLSEGVVGDLLYRCLDAAGIARGAAYLVDANGRLSLRARLGYTDPEAALLADYYGHADLLSRVLEQGEAVELNASRARAQGREDLLLRSGARSVLLAPLRLGEERLGVLVLVSANRELGEDWVSFAKAVASQMSQALELARTLSRLGASEQRYRDLVQGVDAIVWEADARTGRFTFVSHHAEAVLGYPVTRWLEEPDFLVKRLHPEDRGRVLAEARAAWTEGRDHILEYRVLAADERIVWLHDTARVVRDAGGAVRQVRGVMVDVSGRKRLEWQRAQAGAAREVQRRLFPAGPPPLPGFDLGGASYPAEATGGDYFDYVPLPGGCLGLVVGDVSGHGFGPALLMAGTRAYLRAVALAREDAGEVMTLLDKALAADLAPDQFVTLLFGRLDPARRSFAYASAGHTRGYLLDPAGCVKAVLSSTGLPLGVDPGGAFSTSATFALVPGDLVLLLTDGVVDARAPDGTRFGAARAVEIVRAYRRDPARLIVANLYHAVRAFSHNQPQEDDLTAVVLKVEGAPPGERGA